MNLKWRIGDLEIFQIAETDAGDVIQSIMPRATPDAIKRIPDLTPDFADHTGRIKAVVQCFLVKSGTKIVLVDSCNGNDKDRPDIPEWGGIQTDFLAKFRQTGVELHQVTTVVCTHLHFDHVGWNTMLRDGAWVPTFPNAEYIFPRDDYNFWDSDPKGQIVSDLLAFQDSVLPVVDAGQSVLVDATYQVDEHIKLIPTPGHTPGHVCVDVTSREQRAVIIGDLLYHPCQIVNPSWITDSDMVASTSIEARAQILADVADTGAILMGTHVPSPVIVVRQGDGYSFKRAVNT